MTAINFPGDPQVGDTFLNFAWDGEKWRNAGSRANAVVLKDLFEFSVAADDSTLRTVSTGESLKFTGAGTVTTASDAEGNITITGAATNLTGYATETFVTTRGYLTSVGTISYNDLSNKPTLFSGSYTDLTNKPTLFDGAYSSLSGTPTIYTSAYIGTTSLDFARESASQTLTGVSIDGSVVWTNSSPAPGTPWRTTINAASGNANIVLYSGLPGFGSSVSWTLDETKLTFPDNSQQTTAFTGSIAYASVTGTPTLATVATSGSYADLSNKPTIPTNTNQLTNGAGFITSSNIPAPFTFNVAADDSTLRTISSEETVKFVGAGGITTASDAEGAITITGGSTTIGTTAITLGSSSTTLAGLTSVDGASSSFTLLATPTSVTAFGLAQTINLGYTGNTGGSNFFNISTQAQAFNTIKTVNIGTGSTAASTTAVNIGSTLGTSTVTINGSLVGTLTGNASTATKLATARAINGVDFDGSAAITITAAAGTLSGSTLASGVTASSLTSVGTLTGVTSNAVTAFTAGDAAISGVALQVPREGALRNLYNGSGNNMYFDVSIGGTSQGQFQFRSSSSYTNVLTMSSTGVSFNTDATFTSRTPSLARTAFNSAIDTEITVDEMRFRISNASGIFPQVIGNTSSRNLAWTGIGAISGSAVSQLGSTGTIVSSSAWTTLYNGHGMDAAGDTVTVTLQDKAAGRIYRVTFMRSDNGTTTGYNIIGERLL